MTGSQRYEDNKEYIKALAREHYDVCKSKGLCTRCCKAQAREGKTTCKECYDKQRLADKKRLDELVEQGICINCRKHKAKFGEQKCKKCIAKYKTSIKKKRLETKKEVKIRTVVKKKELKVPKIRVVVKKERKRSIYKTDSERTQADYKRKKAAGICTRCTKPTRKGKTTCKECYDKQKISDKRRLKELIENGICVSCKTNKAVENVQKCEECTLRYLASIHKVDYEQLKDKLDKQNNRCFYSGRLLKAGVNLSVEHIKPRSKYLDDKYDMDNIALVDKDVNVAKNNMEVDDFLLMIKDVYEYNFRG